jgi:hypothetical protein
MSERFGVKKLMYGNKHRIGRIFYIIKHAPQSGYSIKNPL